MIVRCKKHDFQTREDDTSPCPYCEDENSPKAQTTLSCLIAELKRDRVTGEARLILTVNQGGITGVRKIVDSVVK